MKDLWRKTWELFRAQWIVLWLPFVCAEFVNLGRERLSRVLARVIFNSLATSHSVLGGSFMAPDLNVVQRQALIVLIPISLAMQFLTSCTYVVAFLLIAKLIESTRQEQTPNFAKSLREIAPQWCDIFLFSLKFCIAYGFLIGALSEGMSLVLKTVPHSTNSLSLILIPAVGLVASGCVAWLLIPAACRLVRKSAECSISVEERKLGMAFAAFGIAASIALGDAIRRAERGFTTTSQAEWTALSLMNLVLVSLPETLTFIALALLALNNSGIVAEEAGPDSSALKHDSAAE